MHYRQAAMSSSTGALAAVASTVSAQLPGLSSIWHARSSFSLLSTATRTKLRRTARGNASYRERATSAACGPKWRSPGTDVGISTASCVRSAGPFHGGSMNCTSMPLNLVGGRKSSRSRSKGRGYGFFNQVSCPIAAWGNSTNALATSSPTEARTRSPLQGERMLWARSSSQRTGRSNAATYPNG
jgi:hypothetical protein